VRSGAWNAKAVNRRVAGSVLGILGFGGTGRALARAALGLGFREILVWSPHIDAARIAEALGRGPSALGVSARPAAFDELLREADWVSVHLPLKPETRGIIGRRELALMKRDAVLVNVSRGAIVEEEALVDALAAGALGGAGLDVFVVEPLPPGSRLRSFPGVIFTDHSAYASRESIFELRRRTAENAVAALRDSGAKNMQG
jgi:D-3-phosphoglycerate dehydrogenase